MSAFGQRVRIAVQFSSWWLHGEPERRAVNVGGRGRLHPDRRIDGERQRLIVSGFSNGNDRLDWWEHDG
jgi:hypothetical protein